MENDQSMRDTLRSQFGHHWRMSLGNKGWLRPTVLKVLEEEPMNGIGIMNKIQEMSHGWWRPSPGSIYPLLETLCNEEMIKKRSDGRYELTKKYTGNMMDDKDEVSRILTNMEGSISYLEELKRTDKSKFLEQKKRISRVAERISQLS